jgi:hypothetical protein
MGAVLENGRKPFFFKLLALRFGVLIGGRNATVNCHSLLHFSSFFLDVK